MNPRKAYSNPFFKKNKLSIFLLVLIFCQLFLLYFHYNSIVIPALINNVISKHFLDDSNIEVRDVSFSFPNNLLIGRFSFLDKDTKTQFKADNIKIKVKNIFSQFLTSFRKLSIETGTFGHIKLKDLVLVRNFKLYNINDNFSLETAISYNNSKIEINGDVDRYKIESILNSKMSGIRADMKFDTIKSHFDKFANFFKFNKSRCNYFCFFALNQRLKFNLIEKTFSTEFQLKENLHLSLQYDPLSRLIDYSHLNIKKLGLSRNGTTYNFGNIYSYFAHDISNNTGSKSLNFFTNIKDIEISGKLSGSFPNTFLSIASEKQNLTTYIIQDSNRSICSNTLSFDTQSNSYTLNGKNIFTPKLFNFRHLNNKKETSLINGDELLIMFNNSQSTNISSNKNFVHISTDKLSVLGSSPGDYEAYGYLNDNFSLVLDQFNGEMGDSTVFGSYIQDWFPLKYDFKIMGTCIPSNINSWLGDWWDKIWLDFKFSTKTIPYGNFHLSGIWNKTSSNKTFGSVYGENFTYKNLPVLKSKINISVDENKTFISSPGIIHSSGKIFGEITIPRTKLIDSVPISYSINGVYPVNEGKMVLGKIIENYLNEINLSSMMIDSNGQFPISEKDLNSSMHFNKYYTINFASLKNGSWNGINFDEIKGSIKSDRNIFKLDLPIFKLGLGLITVKLQHKLLEELLTINIEIENVKIIDLFNSALSYQKKNGTVFPTDLNSSLPSDNGLIDLTLNAVGNIEDLMSFKGTGLLNIQDKQLGKIRLLGFISKGLSELPLPFPNGTLSFNKLEGLFELENGKVLFDQFTLSGLFSKIVSKGYFDLKSGELDILSKVQLVGNIPIPIFSQIAKITDPLSMFAEIKITGNWRNPKWKLLLKPL